MPNRWVHDGTRYDTTVRLIVDVDDNPENRDFFVTFKNTLLERFEQIDIYRVSYPVDII